MSSETWEIRPTCKFKEQGVGTWPLNAHQQGWKTADEEDNAQGLHSLYRLGWMIEGPHSVAVQPESALRQSPPSLAYPAGPVLLLPNHNLPLNF